MSSTEQQAPAGRRREVWVRGLVMLVFIFLAGIGQAALNAIAVIQFLWILATGEANPFLRRFGSSFAKWAAEVVRFQACVSEERPFPWKEWPAPD